MVRVELRVIGGKHHNKVISLPVKKFLIGREQDCHLRPNSESVSRHHCVLTLDDYGAHVRDLGSTNGTLVNGERIHGLVNLKAGDRLTIGKLEFEVLIHEMAKVRQAADGFSSDQQSSVEQPSAIGDSFSVPPVGSETVELGVMETQPDVTVPPQPPVRPLENTGIYSGDTTITKTPELPPQPEMQQQPYPQQPQQPQMQQQPYPQMQQPYPQMQQPPGMPPQYTEFPQYPGMQQQPQFLPQMPQYPPQHLPFPPSETDKRMVKVAPPPLKLPLPEETGARPEVDKIGSSGAESKSTDGHAQQDASNLAANIIRQYRNRRKDDDAS